MNEVWRNLAQAIILQAVKDYRKARKILNRFPDNKAAMGIKMEVESFFLSEWFNKLCALDGVSILDRLDAEEI